MEGKLISATSNDEFLHSRTARPIPIFHHHTTNLYLLYNVLLILMLNVHKKPTLGNAFSPLISKPLLPISGNIGKEVDDSFFGHYWKIATLKIFR